MSAFHLSNVIHNKLNAYLSNDRLLFSQPKPADSVFLFLGQQVIDHTDGFPHALACLLSVGLCGMFLNCLC